ncbi:T9SS type A sorting domain-containing protein [Psychroserpens burtonensis]|uniref:T9SS type A sorting domain-containing protein n=1 Tax=Psychroserpens burtonensis TaxID=49278 RepID=A0A5C7BBH2_9FLAO|nr:T9SS type A sorting domain-containing protein [Psychroserpens burtonensis]TXE20006.1 T9SS type A sorting domain-containing protein [Psychroserpens burtonensis]
MKTILLFLTCLLISAAALSQVSANQVDDFEDGTTQDWIIGNPSGAASPPVNVATEGPDGVDDNYLTYTSTPPETGGAGSKMIVFNAAIQWSSNFTSEGIVAIKFDVRVLTNDLNLRVAFQGPNGKRICTTNAVNIVAGSGWQSIIIPISASNFTAVGGSGAVSISDALAAVNTMRILSSDTPTWTNPDTVVATINLDNITASTTLSTQEFTSKNEFEISPNPAISKLNINLSQNFDRTDIIVYDILGKKIFSKKLNGLSSQIDVSKWNSGVYLVRISTNKKTLTKRFVKQ